ncbi:hypothetical protein BG910_09305 [Neisseria chenwenguii]|uniref:Uncharacterized protein n=2 Tax=Neisseria chenwenguii TaxID=1853278 RepID=A0A220S5H2_9NEIS|nr:hypothetical protein BG910_09305 [Neisseria chenwenguii]ROV56294.1 hypothetical protein EGS38_05855 [Neisseria chenwenguii]
MVIYGLYALAILVGVSALIGVIVAYVKRDDMRGTAYECHIDYLIKTFWYGLAVLVVGWITSFILIGLLVLFAGYIWFTYRVVAGFIKFNDGKAVDPNGWL